MFLSGIVLPAAAQETDVSPWQAATRASLVALSGNAATLSDLVPEPVPERGVLLVVWSLYQPESRRAVRDLEVFRRDHDGADRPVVVGVAIPEYREGPEAIRAFLAQAEVRFAVLVDPTRAVPRALAPAVGDMDTLPHTLWVGPGGRVHSVAVGWRTSFREDLDRVIASTRSRGASK